MLLLPNTGELLVLVVGLCLVLVAQTHSVTTQHTSQRVANNDIQDGEVALSLVVNQIAVLKLLNESSSSCSTREKQLQEMFEFVVKSVQLKEELRIIKETALNEIQDSKAEVLNETRQSSEEATQSLQDIKSETLTELRQQDERRRQEMVEFGVKAEQLKGELRITKETTMYEIQDKKAEVLNETRQSTEEATQSLQDIKSEILTELRQQDERRRQEMVEFGVKVGQLKDEFQIKKETALDEIQDSKAKVLNETRLSNEEATQSLQDIKTAALREIQEMKSELLAELRLHDTGRKTYDTGRKTYKKYSVGVTQPEALEACEQLGGRLALPTNNEENEQIWREIGLESLRRVWDEIYWISGTDQQEEGNWVDSITGEPLHYKNFRRREPSNYDGNEHCLSMFSSSSTWNDQNCDEIGLGYVCEFVN